MFTQVYFHKTRVAYDIHLQGALKEILPGGTLPKPEGAELDEFMKWDDWRVLGQLSDGGGGEHGERLRNRAHYRRIHATNEVCSEEDLTDLERIRATLGALLVAEESASKSWYKTGKTDTPVFSEIRDKKIAPLSRYSSVIANMKSNSQVLLYVRPEDVETARKALAKS